MSDGGRPGEASATHVYVGYPFDCDKCKNTGEVKYGFAVTVRPDGSTYYPCPKCGGVRTAMRAITLEEFGKLFTQTEVHTDYGTDRHTIERYLTPRRGHSGSEKQK